MKIAGTNIDRHAAAAIGLIILMWLIVLGMDIKLFASWTTGLPKHANDWQGCIVMTIGLIVLPCYVGLMLKPPAWLAAWARRP